MNRWTRAAQRRRENRRLVDSLADEILIEFRGRADYATIRAQAIKGALQLLDEAEQVLARRNEAA